MAGQVSVSPFSAKGCLGHYLKNVRKQALSAHEKSVLLSNLLDLLRSSADTTAMLVDDFSLAGGYQAVAEFCLADDTSIDDIKQVFHALKGLLTAGDETVAVHQPTTPLANYQFKLPSALSRSTGTVRVRPLSRKGKIRRIWPELGLTQPGLGTTTISPHKSDNERVTQMLVIASSIRFGAAK